MRVYSEKFILFQKWKLLCHNCQVQKSFQKLIQTVDFGKFLWIHCILTTFLTPFGRFCYNKLPFGISSAPEHFQRRMNNILAGIPGIVCHVDDVLIFGENQKEHDDRLTTALQAIQKAGLTLNHEKCQFNKSCISFLGHIIDSQGISQDPQKTKAITDISPLTTVTQLRRFLGMINQMNRFFPHLAQLSQPLRELLSSKKTWIWGPPSKKHSRN